MSERTFRPIESIRLEAELTLADFLYENELITESQYTVDYMGSNTQSLLESASRSNSPGYYYGKGQSAIHYIDFRNIWNNVRDYPSTKDVYLAMHPQESSVATATPGTWAGRVLSKFLDQVPEARKELIASSVGERTKKEEEIRLKQVDDYADEFGDMSIDGGYQRKSSRSGNIERASTLFPGDLYSDVSRIPRRRWGSWWKRFLRAKTSVQNPDQSIFAMRNWSKHFVMGYQITPTLFFEIWYNNMDSTFSVHDKYGNPVRQGDNIPLIRDALNILFHSVADASPKDAEILNFRSPNLRKVNRDIEQALSGQVDGVRTYADRVKERKEKIIAAEKKERERRQDQQEREMRAAASSRGEMEREEDEKVVNDMKDRIKSSIKNAAGNAVKKSVDAYKNSTKVQEIRDREQNTSRTSSDEDAARKRREERQSGIQARIDRETQEKAMRAQAELKTQEEKISQELEDMKSDSGYFDDERTRQEEIRKAEQELKAIQRATEKYDNREQDFDSRLAAEMERLKNKAEQSRKRRQKKKTTAKDEETLDDYVRANTGDNGKKVNESAMDDLIGRDGDMEVDFDPSDYDQNPLYNPRVNQEVEQVRQKAEASPFTRQMISSMFLEGFVQVYEQTRVRDNRTFVRRIFDRLKIFRGRVDPVALPTRIVSSYMRTKGFFAGTQARADFIIGYTLNDVANFEIWYVQEISGDGKSQYASFYLYDVTAMKILQKDIPYYRNAIQMLMLKIGSDDTKGA